MSRYRVVPSSRHRYGHLGLSFRLPFRLARDGHDACLPADADTPHLARPRWMPGSQHVN